MTALTDLLRVDDRSANSPVVLHVPHASRHIPEMFRQSFVVSPAEIEAELDALTDAFTDRIADGAPGASRVQHGLSRLLVDVERFPGDEEEMNAVGMGVLYTHGSRGQELRRPAVAEREALLGYFDAYSTAFAGLVGRTLDRHDRAVIIDVHSYPTTPLPYELHAHERRPEVCLGVDPFHTPAELLQAAVASFDGFEVLENEPFHGAYVPLRYYQRDRRVQSVMLEVRRDLYLDGEGREKKAQLSTIGRRIRRLTSTMEERFPGERP